MVLKINASYKTNTGYLIPRSHLNDGKGERWCVVQILTGGTTHYTSKYTTMALKEIRKALNLTTKEKVDIYD